MPGRGEERTHAKQEGVKFEFLVAPVQFHRRRRWARARDWNYSAWSWASRMRRDGVRPNPMRRFEFSRARGRGRAGARLWPGPNIGTRMPELEKDWKGFVQGRNRIHGGRPTLPGLYAAGDDVRGADLVVTAIAAGRHAARAMDEYLRELGNAARERSTRTDGAARSAGVAGE